MFWCETLLATPSTLYWLSAVKSLNLFSRGSTELSFLQSNSPCLLQIAKIFNFNTLLSLPKMFPSSTCLQYLQLTYISSLTAFPSNDLPTSLKSLDICWLQEFSIPASGNVEQLHITCGFVENCCDGLTSFQLNGFPALQSLSIEECNCLESIFISEIGSLGQSTLQSLQVSHCDAFRSIPQRMDTLTALESLTLDLTVYRHVGKEFSSLRSFSQHIRNPWQVLHLWLNAWGLQNNKNYRHVGFGNRRW